MKKVLRGAHETWWPSRRGKGWPLCPEPRPGRVADGTVGVFSELLVTRGGFYLFDGEFCG